MNQYLKDRITTSKNRISVTPEGLHEMRNRYLPGGSGPLGAMATICALIELLAEAHGFDIDAECTCGEWEMMAYSGSGYEEHAENCALNKNTPRK